MKNATSLLPALHGFPLYLKSSIPIMALSVLCDLAPTHLLFSLIPALSGHAGLLTDIRQAKHIPAS